MMWFLKDLGLWVTILVGYLGFALFIGRMLSWKWHPDGGKGHDPETCDECRYGEDRDEWFR